jgi:undecaprenyl phosphate-alpha-L-ara4FN deformylase
VRVSIFRPVVDGLTLNHIQVPTTLPTYDELIGLNAIPDTYNEYLLSMIRSDRLNVLTIHAEVEGINYFNMFQDFLNKARRKDIVFKPLGAILSQVQKIAESGIPKSTIPGRDGWIACQSTISTAFKSKSNPGRDEYIDQ